MDRRHQVQTDESEYSITDSIKGLAIAEFQVFKQQFISPEELAASKPEQVLSRMLSTRSYISTTSTLAEQNNLAQSEKPSEQRFREIGKGQCGTVYAITGTDIVAKVPNSSAKIGILHRDVCHHIRIVKAMAEARKAIEMDIMVPTFKLWVTPETTSFWAHHGLRFDPHVDAENYALVAERIFPIPYLVQKALVDVLCPLSIRKRRQEFLARPENKDCLLRVYLGRRETTKDKAPDSVRLRNFPLHVNEMEELDLDTRHYATVLARSLAVLHWKAGVDGNDIEFVLGSSPKRLQRPSLDEIDRSDPLSLGRLMMHNFQRRSISIWLLDFNECSLFEDNEQGLKKIVDSFFWNDPYFPRPGSSNEKDRILWAVFKEEYTKAAHVFTKSATVNNFIAKVEERGGKRQPLGDLF